jgi:hypothetical protein
MRRVTTTVALALCLAGCYSGAPPGQSTAPSGEPAQLLTNIGQCSDLRAEGLLLSNSEHGTDIEVVPTVIEVQGVDTTVVWPSGNDGTSILPVRWPTGFTAVRLEGGKVSVLDPKGNVVAITGSRYSLTGGWLLEADIGGPSFGGPPRVAGFEACGANPQ